MKITGNRNYVKFDMENGYVLKAYGELLVNNQFVVYKKTMTKWEYPHESETISKENIDKIIEEVEKISNTNTIKLIFE